MGHSGGLVYRKRARSPPVPLLCGMAEHRRFTTRIRHLGEDLLTLRRKRKDLRTYGMAYYGFWDVGPVAQTWFYRFLQRPALRHLLRDHRFGFYSVYARRALLERNTDVDRKLFFTQENMTRDIYSRYQDHGLNGTGRARFDLAMGFADLPDERYLRFPLWLLYCFPPEADLGAIRRTLEAYAAAGKDRARRERFAITVARHDRNGIRQAIADAASLVGPVDYAGSWRPDVAVPLGPGVDDKHQLLRRYRYNLCPENTDSPGYVTEKIFQAIAAGCTPVYWGGGGRPEPEVLNPEHYLIYEAGRPEGLREALAAREGGVDWTEPFLPGAAEVIYGFYEGLEGRFLGMGQGGDSG